MSETLFTTAQTTDLQVCYEKSNLVQKEHKATKRVYVMGHKIDELHILLCKTTKKITNFKNAFIIFMKKVTT